MAAAGTAAAVLTIQGSLTQLDSALAELIYAPNTSTVHTDTLTIIPTDPSSSLGGGALVGSFGSVTITVKPSITAPDVGERQPEQHSGLYQS